MIKRVFCHMRPYAQSDQSTLSARRNVALLPIEYAPSEDSYKTANTSESLLGTHVQRR